MNTFNSNPNDNNNQLTLDDPRLTALALGELSDAALMAEVEKSPDLKREFERIQLTAKALTGAFAEEAKEPAPANAEAANNKKSAGEKAEKTKIVRFPLLRPSVYIPISGAAAACFVFALLFEPASIEEKDGNRTVSLNELPPPAASPARLAASSGPPATQTVTASAAPAPDGSAPKMPAASAPASPLAGKEEVIVLSPFEITQDKSKGYVATDTLVGTRIHADFKDVASADVSYGSIRGVPSSAAGEMRVGSYGSLRGVPTSNSTGPAATTGSVVAGMCSPSKVLSNTSGNSTAVIVQQSVAPSQSSPGWLPNYQPAPVEREQYDSIVENSFASPIAEALSTFSIDVDTASYANVRRMLNDGYLPPAGAVRIEEMVNYFSYNYAPPSDKSVPFAAHIEATSAPWAPEHEIVRIGLKGYEIPWSERPASNLVFLVDVSGSMSDANKLPLVREGLKMLVNQLDARDSVAIVTYAGYESLALPSTTANNRETILHAIDQLGAGGSTNGAGGIRLAYEQAKRHYIKDGVNRVILCTDGDFNVGTTSRSDLVDMISEEAQSGVFLSIYAYGTGNVQDSTMEQLADKGNGNYGYVDSEAEARRVFVKNASGNFMTIAKDVKIQVEFNPAYVQAYRLIGYENRKLEAQDFNDDKKDAGEIGCGHTVTALYEIIPAGSDENIPNVDPLEYQKQSVVSSNNLMTIKV
ncbi:MAG TPA: VWA domain-containing protein, partial [Opitutales bacterium]|nr:VWA domain-containing protein [Opitutales bacterium]